MDEKQILGLLEKYESELLLYHLDPRRVGVEKVGPTFDDSVSHLLWMISHLKVINSQDKEKTARWLGFIQGCLWSLGIKSIDSMRHDNQ